jgi:hypothetical protein
MADQIKNAGDLYGYDYSNLLPAGYKASGGGAGNSSDRAAAIKRYQGAISAIKRRGLQPGTDLYNQNAQIIKDIGSKYGYNWQSHIGKDWAVPTKSNVKPTVKPTQPVAPTPAPEAIMANYQSPMTQALMKAFQQGTNTMGSYLPENFEGSPMYKFQKEQGQKDIEKLMAARGLTASGAEVEANSKFLSELNATESEKQRQYAEAEAQRAQNAMQFISQYDQSERQNLLSQLNTNLDRRNSLAQFETNRRDAAKQLNINTLLEILGLQSRNNVANMSYQGMGQQSAYTQALMKALAGFQANNYARRSGGGTPPPMKPYDSSNLELFRLFGNYSNNADFTSAINNLLRF